MTDVLAARVAQPDMQGLPEWRVAELLNAEDAQFGEMPVRFSCRSIAEPAVLSGELALLRLVFREGRIPADVSPTGVALPIPTQGLMAIGTLLDAVDRDLRVDPAVPGTVSGVASMLNAIETMGLLSAQTKTVILAQTTRMKSWAAANGVEVTPAAVSQARGRI
jgi:hypothetical protein